MIGLVAFDRDGAAAEYVVMPAASLVVEPDVSELARLAELAGTGTLRTVISQTFPLAHGRHAFDTGAGARRPGKTVLVVR